MKVVVSETGISVEETFTGKTISIAELTPQVEVVDSSTILDAASSTVVESDVGFRLQISETILRLEEAPGLSLILERGGGSSSSSGLTEAQVNALIEDAMGVQSYQTNDVDVASTITYVGKAKADGTWLVERITESGDDLAKDYANVSNNATRTTYTLAWTNRLTLTYEEFQNLTGV